MSLIPANENLHCFVPCPQYKIDGGQCGCHNRIHKQILPRMKTGIELIAEERQRQIVVEGYDNLHDENHCAFQMTGAAGCYLANAINKDFEDHTHYDDLGDCARFQIRPTDDEDFQEAWPWDLAFDKRYKHDTMRSLVIAGALIAAEIDRLQALNQKEA